MTDGSSGDSASMGQLDPPHGFHAPTSWPAMTMTNSPFTIQRLLRHDSHAQPTKGDLAEQTELSPCMGQVKIEEPNPLHLFQRHFSRGAEAAAPAIQGSSGGSDFVAPADLEECFQNSGLNSPSVTNRSWQWSPPRRHMGRSQGGGHCDLPDVHLPDLFSHRFPLSRGSSTESSGCDNSSVRRTSSNSDAETAGVESSEKKMAIRLPGRAAGGSKPKTPNSCSKHVRQRKTRLRPRGQLVTGKRKYRCEACSQILDDWVETKGTKLSASDKLVLLDQVGMSRRQLDNWFCNRRRLERISQQEKSERSGSAEDDDDHAPFSPDAFLPFEDMTTTSDEPLRSPLGSTPLQHLPDVFNSSSSVFCAAAPPAVCPPPFSDGQSKRLSHAIHDQPIIQASPSGFPAAHAHKEFARHQSTPEWPTGFTHEQLIPEVVRRSSAPHNLFLGQQLQQAVPQTQSDVKCTQSATDSRGIWQWPQQSLSQRQWPVNMQYSNGPSATFD